MPGPRKEHRKIRIKKDEMPGEARVDHKKKRREYLNRVTTPEKFFKLDEMAQKAVLRELNQMSKTSLEPQWIRFLDFIRRRAEKIRKRQDEIRRIDGPRQDREWMNFLSSEMPGVGEGVSEIRERKSEADRKSVV